MIDVKSDPKGAVLRRRALFAAVAATAAVAGAGLAWWRLSPQPANASADASAVAALWTLALATPEGAPLPLQGLKGRPLLINFWATWCPPCVEELPLLDTFYKENKANGWQVLGIAVDKPSPVQAFLARQPLSFPVVMAGMEGVGLSKSLGNTAGGLPFSVLLGSDGRLRERKIGKLSSADLAQWRQLR